MRIIIRISIITAFLIALGINSYAGVSTSAVLFLRIAAGARAAAMGEAFVAVADDATATHWNPAGLGNYPLSSKWFDIKIPDNIRPLKKVALLKGGGSEIDYKKYDIWALTDKGLARYKNEKWLTGDNIETRPDQTTESILRSYTGLIGEEHDEKITVLLDILGKANNSRPIETIDSLESLVMPVVPEDYDAHDEVENAFIALKNGFNQCLIDWERFKKATEQCRDALKDSTLSESEVDRILFSLEKSKMRVLRDELLIPFEVIFEGELNDITADKKSLWVGTTNGLYRFDGKRWQRFTPSEGLPAKNISVVKARDKKAWLGTENGLVIYDAGAFDLQDIYSGLPSKPVSGIALDSDTTGWVALESDLYYFNGEIWRNFFEYQDVLDETPESVYERMQISGTAAERESYIQKYIETNKVIPDYFNLESDENLKDVIGLIDSVGVLTTLNILQDSVKILKAADSAAATEEVAGAAKAPAILPTIERLKVLVDSLGIIAAYKSVRDTSTAESAADSTVAEQTVATTLKIPYTAGIPYDITEMEVDKDGNLWVGTEYGLMSFNPEERKWIRFGYRDYTVEEDISIMDLALGLVDGDSARAGRLAENITIVNDLEGENLQAGQIIKRYANPAGSRVNDIKSVGETIFFATESGTVLLKNRWSRYNHEGLGRIRTVDLEDDGDNLWFVTSDRIKVRASARSQLAMMHVNWLPELADDIYYEFFSYVRNVEGWGTVGGNITFLSYGQIQRTDASGQSLGEFSAFDIAFTLSYGTPLSKSLSGGLSAKIIYSHLSEQGAGSEKGSGTATGLALDVGLLYKMHDRLSWGLAITNIGPDIAYIDVAQSDPLPRNLAFGFAWKAIDSRYNKFLIVAEANKSLAGIGDLKDEMKEVVLNGGAEYWYGSFIAFRGGYVYDQEGDVKTPTLGFGLSYSAFKFDFAYIPSSESVPLANTMRLSLAINF